MKDKPSMYINATNKQLVKLITCSAIFLCQQTTAHAQSDRQTSSGGFSGYVGAGVAIGPEYEGAKESRVLPGIQGRLNWDKRYVSLEGAGLRFNILNSDRFEFGPEIGFDLGRRANIKSAPIRALGKIDSSVSLGGFAAINFPNVLQENDAVSVSASFSVVPKKYLALGETVKRSGGATFDVNAGYSFKPTDQLTLAGGVGLSFSNAAHANKYFSINQAGALASGLAQTTVKGGLRDISVDLSVQYALSERWFIFAGGNYSRLLGNFAKSPIVRVEGRRNQLAGAVGVGWAF
jgi:MipA family protein